MGKVPFALQLYTVRDHLEKDPEGTLKKVKAIGYDYVELAGLAGRTPSEFKRLLEDVGLTPISTHGDLNELSKSVEPALELLHTFGVKFLVVSWGGVSDKAGWLEAARKLDAVGAKLRAGGVRFCYHNHAHEFERFDGQCVLDLLFANTAPEHLAAQLDVYWVKHGGADPVAYINKYKGRCPLLHIKDMSRGEPHTFAEVGRGVIDMSAVFAAGKAAGVVWNIVEQDTCAGDSLESARISAEYMAKD